MRFFITLAFILISLPYFSQVYIDTTISMHSKYNSIDQGMTLGYYIYPEAEYNTFTNPQSREEYVEIYHRYLPTKTVAYFPCGMGGLLSPYDAFNLIINGKEYKFQIYESPYNLKLINNRDTIELSSKVNPECWRYDGETVEIHYSFKKSNVIKTEKEIKTSPFTLENLSKLKAEGLVSLKFIIENQFHDRLEMQFQLDTTFFR